MIKVSISIYLKRSTSVLKSVNTKPRKIKNIYQKRSASVRKSVNTKLRMINCINIKFYLSEEECKCAQVRKHKAAHDKSININLFEEEYKCAQVRKHKAAHEN